MTKTTVKIDKFRGNTPPFATPWYAFRWMFNRAAKEIFEGQHTGISHQVAAMDGSEGKRATVSIDRAKTKEWLAVRGIESHQDLLENGTKEDEPAIHKREFDYHRRTMKVHQQ